MKHTAIPFKLEFHGVMHEVPEGILPQHFKQFAEALYGMTAFDSDEKAAAEWALMRATSLMPILMREAMERTYKP